MRTLLLLLFSALTLLGASEQPPGKGATASELSCGAEAAKPRVGPVKTPRTGILGAIQQAIDWFKTQPQIVALEPTLWKTSTLRVTFLDGDSATQRFVMDVAKEWEQGLKLTFAQSKDLNAELRVTFNGNGVWSKVGNRAATVANGQPTMGLNGVTQTTDANLRRAYVLHEFGHALGALHEHQRPGVPLTWRTEVLYPYYLDNYGWSEEKVKKEVIRPLQDEDLIKSPEFDRLSVMMYPILKDFTKEGFVQPWNSKITETDRSLMATLYK